MYTNRVFGTVKGVLFIYRGRHLGASVNKCVYVHVLS